MCVVCNQVGYDVGQEPTERLRARQAAAATKSGSSTGTISQSVTVQQEQRLKQDMIARMQAGMAQGKGSGGSLHDNDNLQQLGLI